MPVIPTTKELEARRFLDQLEKEKKIKLTPVEYVKIVVGHNLLYKTVKLENITDLLETHIKSYPGKISDWAKELLQWINEHKKY